MIRAFLFLLFSSLCFSLTAQTGYQIRGVVIDPNGEPLPGATVFIPSIKAGAVSNEEGIFSIGRLEPGKYALWVAYVGYDTLRQVVEIPPSLKSVNVKLVLFEKGIFADEVEITSQRTGKIETRDVKLGNVEISARNINLLPSIGAPDLMQYLQVLPGVVFTGDQGGQLYIRGGTMLQNLTTLDGMYIYSPFHSIGIFSVFDPDYMRSADVFSAGFPANYGGRVSSVIDIKTRNGNFREYRGKVNVNPFMSSALIEGPLSRSRKQGGGVSFLLSARQNYIDRTSPQLYKYVNNGEGLPFNFQDLYGKITMSDGVNFVNVFGFRQTDNVNYEFPANLKWNSSGGGANFMLLPEGAGAIIRGSFAASNYFTTLASDSERFPRESSISGFNGGLDVSYIVNSVDEFSAGINFLGFSTNYIFTNSFGFITRSEADNTEMVVYSKYKKVFRTHNARLATGPDSSWDLFVLEPGVHMHYYNDQSFASVEPRLRAKFNLPRMSLSGAIGTFSQNLMPAVSDRDVVNFFQGFLPAPPSLANRVKQHNLQTAFHAVGGVELELAQHLSTTVEVWLKDFTQLSNINRDKIFPEDPDFITEIGKAYGADIVLQYDHKNLYLYGTYGWAKNTRNDFVRIYPPVWDRRHNANFVASLRLKPFEYLDLGDGRKIAPRFKEHRWEFGARWTLGSGFPFTQTQGYFEKLDFLSDGAQTDIATQNGQLGLLLASEVNAGRLPYYHRLDLSVKRRWLIRNASLLELNASVINTYNRDNLFYFDRVRFEPVYQLPVLPSMGATLSF